jgi:hypothetical protein
MRTQHVKNLPPNQKDAHTDTGCTPRVAAGLGGKRSISIATHYSDRTRSSLKGLHNIVRSNLSTTVKC